MAKSDNKPLEALQLEVKASLESLGCGIAVRTVATRQGDLRMLFTIPEDEPNMSRWYRLLSDALATMEKQPYYLLLGRKMMLNAGRLIMPWILVLDANNAGELPKACMALRTAFLQALNLLDDAPKENIVTMDTPWDNTFSQAQRDRVTRMTKA